MLILVVFITICNKVQAVSVEREWEWVTYLREPPHCVAFSFAVDDGKRASEHCLTQICAYMHPNRIHTYNKRAQIHSDIFRVSEEGAMR